MGSITLEPRIGEYRHSNYPGLERIDLLSKKLQRKRECALSNLAGDQNGLSRFRAPIPRPEGFLMAFSPRPIRSTLRADALESFLSGAWLDLYEFASRHTSARRITSSSSESVKCRRSRSKPFS